MSGSFLIAKGDQLVLEDKPALPVKIKGFNYFPQRHPWAIFSDWDPADIDRELSIAESLNCNAIRFFVNGKKAHDQTTLDRIVAFVDLLRKHGMRGILTMFDGYYGFPEAGSEAESKNFEQIEALAARLDDDPAIMAWDITNEPDWTSHRYWSWHMAEVKDEAKRRIDWLYRMSEFVRKAAPRQLVTVGLIFNYNNYLPADFRTVESFVDFVSYHYYPRNYRMETFVQSIRMLKQHTNKPINLEEIGYSSMQNTAEDEKKQAELLTEWFDGIEAENVTGLLLWTLCEWWDQWKGPEEERRYGLLRADGKYTMKPATDVFKERFRVASFG